MITEGRTQGPRTNDVIAAVKSEPPARKRRPSSISTVEPEYLRVIDVARLLAISRSSAYGLMEKGLLPFARFGKSRRVAKRDLEEYRRRSTVGTFDSDAV